MARDLKENSHHTVFNQLRALVGAWQDNDSSTRVDFRMSANDSVLVETWVWPERNIEALTLYHMNGEQLMATHYCPVGNQPRLLLEWPGVGSRITFKFESATNLPDPDVDHNVEFWFKINSSDSFTRSETYLENGKSEVVQSTFRRAST